MARHAAAEDRVMVHFGEREPGRRAMAVFAKLSAENVVCRLRYSLNASARRMTSAALRRRTLKDGPDMTTLAIDPQMSAVDSESCCEVIEI